MTDLPASGHGPQSVLGDAKSYFEIAAEDERRSLAERGLGRWGAEAKPPLAPGEVPHLPEGSPWAAPDGFGTSAPFADTNPHDPSGTLKGGID